MVITDTKNNILQNIKFDVHIEARGPTHMHSALHYYRNMNDDWNEIYDGIETDTEYTQVWGNDAVRTEHERTMNLDEFKNFLISESFVDIHIDGDIIVMCIEGNDSIINAYAYVTYIQNSSLGIMDISMTKNETIYDYINNMISRINN